MRTLDLSNHDYSTFDPACLKAAGVERVILGCWDFAIAETMLLALRNAGITVEDVYCFLYYRLPWENNDILNADVLQQRHGGIKRIWLDCEAMFDGPAGLLDTEAEGTTVIQRLQLTQSWFVTMSREFEVGIYTGRYWWRDKMANSTWFAERGAPLWLANYGTNDPDNPRPPILEEHFGGWTKPAVHQYSSTIPVCGRGRDHNYWFLEEGLSVEDRARLDRLERLLAGNGIAKDLAKPDERTTGEEALAYADQQGWSAFLGLGLTQQALATHEHASGGGNVPEHTHIPGGVQQTWKA